MKTRRTLCVAAFVVLAAGLAAQWAAGNGGPFVVKYPGGDPAAKGVLARLDPSLKPAQETRLRVVKEDLTVRFYPEFLVSSIAKPPLVEVSAVYTIKNPTDRDVQADFGFPILRGIYLRHGMMNFADVHVKVNDSHNQATVISNSAIYGLIRQNARELIEKGIADDAEIHRLVAAVRAAWAAPETPATRQSAAPAAQSNAKGPAGNAPAIAPASSEDRDSPGAPTVRPPKAVSQVERQPTAAYLPARESLRDYLTARLGWKPRDAALLVEYASLEFDQRDRWYLPRDRWEVRVIDTAHLNALKLANLGPLVAIGEQKATQFFARLAARFDEKAGSDYEAIFAAWGGDARERSIDLAGGQVRPREMARPYPPGWSVDPTVYARLDYLDPKAKLSPAEKTVCEAVLKNLPVTFTFAPMNLLYYQVKFPAHGTRTVAVEYRQYAYIDTAKSQSYQLAYVLHPATLWQDFGPIHVKVEVPQGISCRASAPLGEGRQEPPPAPRANALPPSGPRGPTMEAYEVMLDSPEQKRGELFVGIDKKAWDKMFGPRAPKPATPQRASQRKASSPRPAASDPTDPFGP